MSYVLASPFYSQLRKDAGLPYFEVMKQRPPAQPVSAEELVKLLASSRPILVAVIGVGALVTILWLMVLKPF